MQQLRTRGYLTTTYRSCKDSWLFSTYHGHISLFGPSTMCVLQLPRSPRRYLTTPPLLSNGALAPSQGVKLYRVDRDEEYWAMLYDNLGYFWFEHVLPAREALAQDRPMEKVRNFEPVLGHLEEERLIDLSREIAENATLLASTTVSAQYDAQRER
eukprot:scaffold412_cov388-Prasinococcus_capsulatus_cf.AAC.41